MSIIVNVGNAEYSDIRLTPEEIKDKKLPTSLYKPTDDEAEIRNMIIRQFTLGYQTMYKPRLEFNDMSVIGRDQVDKMAMNVYQPNNGDAPEGDLVNGWRSNAIRPVVRNKCVSIAAHATAQLMFPKVFAFNDESSAQEDAARVMRDLMEWSAEQSNYSDTSLEAVLTATWSPASIRYTEYGEVFRNVKSERGDDGKWKVERMLDEDLSGFKDTAVPVEELYIENIYESDIQKQGWLIWRRVIGYDLASVKYGESKDWKYVKPGVQIIFNDANQFFYEVYDSNMRTECVEEVIYWNKKMDLKLVLVNGVLLTDFDNPNPRRDKLYPFVKFGYELIDEGKFFYYKSLAFKMQSDANIIKTLYPMIIDGTYLNIFQPMVNYGSETIGSDVIVPGGVTTLSDPTSKLEGLSLANNIKAGMDTLLEVEKSVSESSEDQVLSGQQNPGQDTTAYEISRLEQNANTVLGLFIKMISQYVRQYGRLRMGDILQHLTIVDVDRITDDPQLVYRTFLVKGSGKFDNKKIQFTDRMPDEPISGDEAMVHSYKVLSEQDDTGMEIYKVNPRLWRDLKYQLIVSPDVLHPRSEDLERAMKLELYDRAIQNPMANQEKVYTDFLLGSYKDIHDPDEYVQKQQAPQGPGTPGAPGAPQGMMPMQPSGPGAPPTPGGSRLPQIPSTGQLK